MIFEDIMDKNLSNIILKRCKDLRSLANLKHNKYKENYAIHAYRYKTAEKKRKTLGSSHLITNKDSVSCLRNDLYIHQNKPYPWP